MSATARTSPEVGTHAAVERRRSASTAMLALAGASVLLLMTVTEVGPPWVHWVGSLVALAAALSVVIIAELHWQRAVSIAKAAGLVERSRP